MLAMVAVLVIAALLETGGDAAIRQGLVGGRWVWLLAGSAALVLYGFLVNTNRAIDFNRLMGGYIALFLVVSQVVAWAAFGERPSGTLLVGGALVVAGGLVIQAGAP
jgi:small multidrug resistance family-3 protein